jgi:CheY-like chemotaxis protein
MNTRVSAQAECTVARSRAVLWVDDNPDDLLLFQLAWEKAQVVNPVRCTSSRKEAMDYLEGRGKFADRNAFPLPCVVVIDMRLPDGKACDFLKWIRAHSRFKKLVVIVLSGTAHQEEVNEAYRSGANSFLVKSPNPRHLHETIGLIQTYWLNQNYLPKMPAVPASGVLNTATG